MNKQEIEKAIGFLSRYLDEEVYTEHCISTHMMAISALQQQLNNGWIPCSETLPVARQHESGEPIEYNIMLRYGTVATTGIITPEGVWGWINWNDYEFYPIGVDVIAWQPLPEPYKEVSHDRSN